MLFVAQQVTANCCTSVADSLYKVYSDTSTLFNVDEVIFCRLSCFCNHQKVTSISISMLHVVADCISFASTFVKKSERAHFAAPPFQIAIAALDCDLVWVRA